MAVEPVPGGLDERFPGSVAVAEAAGPPPPERRYALHVMRMVNQGVARARVVGDAVRVLSSPGRRDPVSCWCAVLGLMYAGETELAEGYCARSWTPGVPEGGEALRATLLGRLAWQRGDPAKAADLLRGVVRSLGRHPRLREVAMAWLITATVDTGDLDAAYGLVLDHAFGGDSGNPVDDAELLAAKGELDLAAGRHDIARAGFLACGRKLTALGVRNPAVVPWQSRAALCAEASGRRGLAVVLANRELIRARRWADPRTLGVAKHAHAVIVDRTCDAVREAVSTLAELPAVGETLRARYDLAHFLAAEGRHGEARACLREVADIAGKHGYRRWRAQAETASGRMSRRTGDRLTRQERKIARLARSGLGNRRIAEREYLTLRTVEFHLSSVYRKLGISGRRELVALPGQLF
ncbi:helix-turn-helix transcriptional regulator [Amycolatopsis samaneae]|uniref:LuxR C-terminal-related transcriptional regulator n=1 Tax=Amycolatopsis samaneae TaxID=664691 RepID=A0ABW5GFT8_9PSEU